MKDKNGIEIIRENCKHKTPCNGCGLVERDCKVGDKHCQFTPSLNVLEQRIAELEAELAKCEFKPIVESDFENDRNEIIRGVFIVRQFEFEGVFHYSILDGYEDVQIDKTLEEVNNFLKQAWQEFGGAR